MKRFVKLFAVLSLLFLPALASAQTQEIPETPKANNIIAPFMGYQAWAWYDGYGAMAFDLETAQAKEKPFKSIYFPRSILDSETEPAPCNSHQRKWYKPFSSNMCQEDYDKWVTPRLHDHWYKDKYFWLGGLAIGGSIALDSLSTSTRPKGIIERNPILGSNPSNGKIAGVASTDFAIHFGLHVLAWKQSHNDPSMAWRQFGRWGVPATTAIEFRQGVLNYRLRSTVKPAGTP